MALKGHGNRYRNDEGFDSAGMDDWMTTYSDTVTLLMCFFLLLIAVSKVDIALWESMKSGLRSEISGEEKTRTPLAEIKQDLDSLLTQERSEQMVQIDLGADGIVMEFASSAFYAPGNADVGPKAQVILDKVIKAMRDIEYYKFKIDIEGHTDDSPIRTMRFPSNWELSVARATNIVQYMIQKGIEANRLKAAGYADTRPLVPNRDSLGVEIPENQSRNRRIVVRIH